MAKIVTTSTCKLAPEGYDTQLGKVCKLKQFLYRLKQTSRQWNVDLTTKLIAFGIVQSAQDHSLFTKHTDSGHLVLLVYVDDVLVASLYESSFVGSRKYLDDLFTIQNLGYGKYSLGL
ncbi:UNVERIFIED_CONTAM: hypothetical protein Slati_2680700 [Sesamum latifolium]|uniref:Reverse transcriptase Ty1/copia-type domain-containing protein n=1 Tax=Sesamum latifolium TaxID=2727402 RepID=A0AAW2VUP3_9LAMI